VVRHIYMSLGFKRLSSSDTIQILVSSVNSIHMFCCLHAKHHLILSKIFITNMLHGVTFTYYDPSKMKLCLFSPGMKLLSKRNNQYLRCVKTYPYKGALFYLTTVASHKFLPHTHQHVDACVART